MVNVGDLVFIDELNYTRYAICNHIEDGDRVYGVWSQAPFKVQAPKLFEWNQMKECVVVIPKEML